MDCMGREMAYPDYIPLAFCSYEEEEFTQVVDESDELHPLGGVSDNKQTTLGNSRLVSHRV